MTEQDLKPWDAAYTDAYGPTYSTKKAPALSRVPRGHWRNLWRDPMGQVYERPSHPEVIDVDAFHFLSRYRWPSREIAEQKALEDMAQCLDTDMWIEAQFFPES